MPKKTEKTVEIRGRQLVCHFCGYAMFYERRAQLHSMLATFFNFEWLGPRTTCFVYGSCGHVHWFLRDQE